MYLKSALNIAIPYACRDRESLSLAYDHKGPHSEDALKMAKEMLALKGLTPAKFTQEQMQAARNALVYAEQFCESYRDAVGEVDKVEYELLSKQLLQIRTTRRRIFGSTIEEDFYKRATVITASNPTELFKKIALLAKT